MAATLKGDELTSAQWTLTQAFTTLCGAEDSQRRLFSVVDVVLTGALLAGGANGLHERVKRFEELGKRDY